MMPVARRGLSQKFLDDLKTGLLAPLRQRVVRDQSLCLEIRENYINVYYRGGSVMRVEADGPGYSAFFDPKYFQEPRPSLPEPKLREASDVSNWLTALPTLKEAMDLAQPGAEREIQQCILRDNNHGTIARSTDYYLCDIEHANDHGRFDFVAVRWPSTPHERKAKGGHRLVLGEVKFGDGALEGPAGLHAHVRSVNNFLEAPGSRAALEEEMVRVFNQKRALELIDCGNDLLSFSDERPMLLLVLVNHDPAKTRLRELLRTLPESRHAELRIATSLMGYGLYDPAILTVDEAFARFESCI